MGVGAKPVALHEQSIVVDSETNSKRRINSMKKFVIALLFLMSTFALGQDGRTKINYINSTSQVLNMLIDGRPACAGPVIASGFCTEIVYPGTYLAQATNGSQITAGASLTLADGDTATYTVTEDDSENVMPNQSQAKLVTVSDTASTYADLGFSVVSPIALTRDATTSGVTHSGLPYTYNVLGGTYANGDELMLGVSNYGTYQVVPADLQRAADGFAAGVKGTIVKQEPVLLNSGQQGLMSAIIGDTVNGKTMAYLVLDVYKGNTFYQVAFAAPKETPSDMEGVKKFFSSFTIQ